MSDIDLAAIAMILLAWGVVGVVASLVWKPALWLAAPMLLMFGLGIFAFAVVAPLLLIYDNVA